MKKFKFKKNETSNLIFKQDGIRLISCTCEKSKMTWIPVSKDKYIPMCGGCGDIINIEPTEAPSIKEFKPDWNRHMDAKQRK